MRFGGSCSLRPGCLAPSSKLQAVRRWRPAIQATSTFGVNQAKPAYKISSRSWAPLIYSPTTLNLRTLNDQSMGDYNMDSINVEDYRRERGVPGIEDALDVFRVTVKVNPADLLLLPVRPTIGEEAEAAAKEQGADEKMAKIAAEQALASFDALIEVMREHGSFEYTLDRHLHMLPELERTMGQRVLYIGNQGPGGEGAEVHDLKRLLVDLASKGCMVDKNNVWVLYHPGGRPDQLMEYHGITHGVSHGGRISVAWNDDLEDVLKGNSKSPTTVRSRALDVGQISGGAIQREKPRQPEPTETEVATDTDMDLSAQDLDRLKMLWYDQPATFQGNPTLYDPTQAVWWSLTVFDPSTVEWGGLELADRPPIQPDLKTFRAWVENTEMWSVLDLITVPYPEDTMDDRMAGRSAYERNPVEIKKATDLNPYASNILTAACSPVNSSECKAALDILHGYAEYCEEGKVNAKNVGLCVPLNWRSVEEGRIDRGAFTWFAEMAAAFESRSPEQAWKWLRDEGYIDEDQFSILQYRGYIHQRLRVLDDSVRSWTDYRPKGVETNPQEDGYGLYTRPVTAVTLTAHYMASNFPREELTKGFLKGVDKVLSLAEDNAARQSLVALAQGRGLVEVTPQAVAGMLAIALLDGILRLTRPKLLEKMRYEDMNDADKEKLDNYLDKFHALAVNPALDRDTLVVEIKKLNDEFRDVKFQSLQGRMGQTIPSKEIRALQFYTPLQGIECPKGAPFMPEMVGHHHLAFMINDHYRN